MQAGYYRESYHSEVERASRNISIQDIRAGLERDDWILAGESEFDATHGEWKYTIKTVDLEGDQLHLRIAVNVKRFSFMVVTKW